MILNISSVSILCQEALSLTAEAGQARGEIVGRVVAKHHLAATGRVDEAKLGGVEHEPWRRDDRAREAPHVDALADQRVPRLGQVDADLMGAPGLEPAGHERGELQKMFN